MARDLDDVIFSAVMETVQTPEDSFVDEYGVLDGWTLSDLLDETSGRFDWLDLDDVDDIDLDGIDDLDDEYGSMSLDALSELYDLDDLTLDESRFVELLEASSEEDDLDTGDGRAEDAYGNLLGALAKGLVAGAAPTLGKKAAEQMDLGSTISRLTRGFRRRDMMEEEPEVATSEQMPPVYSSASKIEAPSEAKGKRIKILDLFGEVVKKNWLDRFGAEGRQAAERSVRQGSRLLQSTRPGSAVAFVEDAWALPVLEADGTIYEPSYGVMTAVPCPSCSVVSYGAVRAGHADDCGVCDGYGALLVPESDLSHYAGVRYGIIGTVALLGGTALGTAAYKAFKEGKFDDLIGRKGKGGKGKAGKGKTRKKKGRDNVEQGEKAAKKKRSTPPEREQGKSGIGGRITKDGSTSEVDEVEADPWSEIDAELDELESETGAGEDDTWSEIDTDLEEIERMGALRVIVPSRWRHR